MADYVVTGSHLAGSDRTQCINHQSVDVVAVEIVGAFQGDGMRDRRKTYIRREAIVVRTIYYERAGTMKDVQGLAVV